MTEGQKEALDQLEWISSSSGGRITVGRPTVMDDYLSVPILVDCSGIEVKEGGLPLRARETFRILVPNSFPFEAPTALVSHRRFADQAHVQWGFCLCLYQAPSVEWDPSRGMFGFIARLGTFLEVRASGKEDLDGAPMHPPVAYVQPGYETIVSESDCPQIDGRPWIGLARMADPGERPRSLTEYGVDLEAQEGSLLAPTFLLARRMPHEFPKTLEALIAHLRAGAVSDDEFRQCLGRAARLNPKGEPLYVVIGTPMRQGANGEVIPHLEVWRISEEEADWIRELRLHEDFARELDDISVEHANALDGYRNTVWRLVGTKVLWCYLHETRPQATERRDANTLADTIAGKRVAVLGCGALGAPIALAVSRMGPSRLRLFDNKRVSPGVLSRQPYRWRDVGGFKAECLAEQIREADERLDVEGRVANALSLLDEEDWSKFDLIIDATANLSVLQKLDLARNERRGVFPDLLSLAVGPECQRGIVRACGTCSKEGPWAVDRRAKFYSSENDHTYLDEFWPERGDAMFQPEPGCSDPTFRGSSADALLLATSLLNSGLGLLQELSPNGPCGFALLSQPTNGDRYHRQVCRNAERFIDGMKDFDVLISKDALASMDEEMRKMAQLKPGAETGGILIGELSPLHRTVFVDVATGPPRDSERERDRFVCGVDGVRNLVDRTAEASRGARQFVGIWHSHPAGRSTQSDTDIGTMCLSVLEDAARTRWSLMVIRGRSKKDVSAYLYSTESLLSGDNGQGILARVVEVA